MNTGDLLTVKEFAEKAGVSKQRIYKLMVDSLQPYTIKQENGYTMLKAEGLKVFGMYAELKPCNPVGLKPCNDEQMQAGSGIEPKTVETLQPYRVETLQQSVIDTQAAEIETLKQQLETLQDQLTAKDKQISLLQAHTADQQQTIQSLTAMLHPQQQLNAAAAVIQKQLIDQSEGTPAPAPEPSPTETGSSSTAAKEKENAADQSEGTPKRGILTHIQAALGGKSYKRKRNRRSRIRK